MKERIKLLEKQNQILKDLNDVNNKLIEVLKSKSSAQEQMIALLKYNKK